jgi:hypothetical protein
MKTHLSVAVALIALSTGPAFAQGGKPDAEGYIRDWLVLAPYPVDSESGASEIDKQQFATEAQPAAQDGVAQKVGSKQLTWKKTTAKAFYLDFKELHPDQSENVVAWAVAYVTAPAALTGITLAMNSNDQGKVYLNGQELVKFTDTRTLEKDAEDLAKNVTLKPGVNVLVLKVINQENNWQGSVRFLEASGKPITNLKISTAR